jgi:3-oxoacyl-[acyl-carrier protein] reductase
MKQSLSLSGKHVLVCGASSGIGQSCALALAAQRANVTVLARNEDKLKLMVGNLQVAGAVQGNYVVADMDDFDGLMSKVDAVIDEFGPIHVVVHNTGGPRSGPILEMGEDDLLATFRRHQLTAHGMLRRVLPGMVEASYGRFINILSTSAKEPIPNLGLSNTIRAGMLGWAKTVANELPPCVTINSVLPGFTATERLASLEASVAERTGQSMDEVRAGWISTIPEGRLGRPDEIAAAVVFLASSMASYIRGHALPVEGGRLKGF